MMRSDADMKMMIELEFSGSFLGLALKILPTVAMTTISLTGQHDAADAAEKQ